MFRKLISGVTSTAVIGGLVTAGAVAASVATAAPAAAETVTIGAVSAQMAGHTGKASGTAGNAANCIRFAPPDTNDNPAVKTEWVTGSNEAAAGHGKPTSGTFDGQCPPTLIKTIPGGQSAVGITPTAEQSADTDNPFLLGTMRHYNNPINVQEDPAKFVGDLNIEFKGEVFTFPYELYETPNQCNGKVDDEQVNCSDDILTFTSTPTGEVDIQVDGVTYAFSLVASGFTGPDEEGICPVSPDPAATAKTKFITTEGKITTGCLYGELAQKRSITLVKKVEWNPDVTGPTTIPDFAFTSTSDLVGSPWKTDPGNLKPANTNPGTASYGPKDFRAGVETVTITEGADPTNWTFKDVQCVADGKVLTAADGVTPSGRTVELKNVPDATTQAAVPITCTYTNTYTPPGINVVKTANKAEVHAGDSVIYSYAVTNTGLSPLSNVTLVDDKCQSVSGPTKTGGDQDALLEQGETWTYSCTSTLQTTTTNIATASGKDNLDKPVTDTDQATVVVPKPAIKVDKSADKAEVKAGGEVVYTYQVSNKGDTPLLNVTVTDDKCAPVKYESGDTDKNEVLGLEETWTFTCTTTLKETTENTAVASGKDRTGQPVEDTDKATVVVPKPGIKVDKSADKAEVKAGGSVTYTYTVTNTGDTPLLNVTVTDDKCAPVKDESGDADENEILGLEETWTFTCTTTLKETTENTAVASGEDRTGQPVEDTATAKVIVPKPGMKVDKTASAASVTAGQSVTYTYTVTNTGDIELLNVKVTDDKCAPVEYKSGDDGDNKLQKTETWIFNCTTVLNEPTTNTAVASGEDRTGQTVSSEAKASVNVTQVSPVVAKRICPIDVTLHKPQPTKVGNRVMTDKIKTKKSSCVLLKPVVLCRPIAATTAGETAFCDTKVTKKGRVTVKTKGYEAVRVTVLVRTKPKSGFFDLWKPNTWRKSWKLK